MTKRLPAASEIVAKVLQGMGENLSVDEIEDIYEQNVGEQPANRHGRRKARREVERDAGQVEKAATEFVQNSVERMAWVIFGKYPEPPEWEKPTVIRMMEQAMCGDDNALAWLKQRFPPEKGLV